MRKLLLAFLLLTVPAFGYTLKQVRSLSAAAAVTNGAHFDGSSADKMPPSGGGVQWTVLITGSSPSLSYQIQVQMTDGTWVPASPAYGSNGNPTVVLTGVIPASSQSFTFFGPYQDMRVAVTAYTSGSLTADIFVEY